MRLKPMKRAPRRRAVFEAALAAYSQGQEERAAVRSSYRRWASATALDEPRVFDAYEAEPGREQRAATLADSVAAPAASRASPPTWVLDNA